MLVPSFVVFTSPFQFLRVTATLAYEVVQKQSEMAIIKTNPVIGNSYKRKLCPR